MKSIKNIALSAMLAVGSFSAVTYTSCTKDECKDVVCQNGGSCAAGICNCPSGYEGATCATLSRDKFIGTFTGTETCTIGSDAYAITTTTHSDPTKFNITNLYNQSFVAVANADGNSFTIPNQSIGATQTASGSGNISGNTITITYTIDNGGVSNTCTYSGSK